MQTIEEVAANIEAACKKATLAMADIPEPLRSEGLAELVENVQKWLLPLSNPERSFSGLNSDTSPLPPPTEAVTSLLSLFPAGLTMKEIVAQLAGKFQTSSPEPEKILYATMKRLRVTGAVVDIGGRYKNAANATIEPVAPQLPETPVSTEATILHRVFHFFITRNYQGATVEEISKGTNTPEASLRHLFSSSHPHIFQSEKINGNLNRWFLKPEFKPAVRSGETT